MFKYQKNPIFIVSCGRTGSTLISNILNDHREICIISDLIEPVGNNSFLTNKEKKITGDKFFEEISRKTSQSRINYWRKHKTKELLFLPKKDDDVSCLNCYTLPFLFKDVNNKYNLIKNYFFSQKRNKKSKHLLNFFNLLKNLSKKKLFVERTGGAIHHFEKIINFFPNSKIIFSYRNPLETAISMRNYPFFRMYELMRNNKKLSYWNFNKKKSYWKYGDMLENWYKVFFKNKSKIKKNNFYSYSFEKLSFDSENTLGEILKFILNKRKLNSYDIDFISKKKNKVKRVDLKFNQLSVSEKNKLTLSLSNTINKLYAN